MSYAHKSHLPTLLRRPQDLFLRLVDVKTADLRSLLRGELEVAVETELVASVPVAGREYVLSKQELEAIASISANGPSATRQIISKGVADEQILLRLLEAGLLVAEDDPRVRARASLEWHPVSALFHGTCLYGEPSATESGQALSPEEQRDRSDDDVDSFIRRYGEPPAPRLVFSRDPADEPASQKRRCRLQLELEEFSNDDLFQTLQRRRTCRHFSDTPLQKSELSSLMRWTFGVQAMVQVGPGYTAPLKTSPSGGAIHPIEAFLFALSVQGVEPAIYHYDSFDNSLTPLLVASRRKLGELLVNLASGQAFVGEAAMAVLLVARLKRNFWKYPNRCRTYAVMHQDVGHLSQTFYLVATRLGLGAFYTAAVDGRETRSKLGLEDMVDAPMGLLGSGVPDESAQDWLQSRICSPERILSDLACEVRYVNWARTAPEEASVDSGDKSTASSADFWNLRISPSVEK